MCKYDDIISIKNLYLSWQELIVGKKEKFAIADFVMRLSENIFKLNQELVSKIYRHGGYEEFAINDPKPRTIHNAQVRDKIVHRAIKRILYPNFDKKFIFDSYSSRDGKGHHLALNRFRDFGRKVSQNNTRTCWVLKCDIRKCFASIDHTILKEILTKHTQDKNIFWLLVNVIDSFHSTQQGKGLPLGNLTSQLLMNVYMNEFDQFIKHNLRIKSYIRYADDFVIFSRNRDELESLVTIIRNFLHEQLLLQLHPDKLFISTLASGVDFLGWVHFPDHRILRTSTKKRMFRNLSRHGGTSEATVNSYLGMLKHGNAHKLRRQVVQFG